MRIDHGMRDTVKALATKCAVWAAICMLLSLAAGDAYATTPFDLPLAVTDADADAAYAYAFVSDQPLTVQFDGSASEGYAGAAIVSYAWDFGDPSSPGGSDEASCSHTYAEAETYTAVLTVTDAGGVSRSASAEVVILEDSTQDQPLVVIVDNLDAEVSGPWGERSDKPYGDYIDVNFLSIQKTAGVTDTVTFRPNLSVAGEYEVYHYNQTRSMCSDSVKVIVTHVNGSSEAAINQRLTANRGWSLIGTYSFNAGNTGSVTISTDGITNDRLYVHADAVKFVGAGGTEPPAEYMITSSAGTGGSINPDGAVIVTQGNDQNFALIADPGYLIADLFVDGISVGAIDSHTFTNVTADHTIHAEFTLANRPPVADDIFVTTGQDVPVLVTMIATEPDNDAMLFSTTTLPSHGVLSGLSAFAGTVTYTPYAGFTGTDSFDYEAIDRYGARDSATVTITVTGASGNGPMAHWKLDETDGKTASDATGNGHDGTLSYSGWSWTPDGHIDGALAMTNAFGRVIVDTPLDVGDTHTIAAWFTAPIKDGSYLYLVGDPVYNGFISAGYGELGVRSVALNRFVGCGFDMRSLGSGWHHVAAVAEGGVTAFYVDGAYVGEVDVAITTEVSALGNDANGGNAFSSTVDDVRIYDRALSAAEIHEVATPIGSSNLLFKSGFEPTVTMAPMDNPYNRTATYQGIEGSDVLGYSWPIQLRSPALAKFHHIINAGGTPVADLNDYFDTHIETVTGHDGLPTEALYQGLTQAASSITQSRYELNYHPITDTRSDEDTYIKYWMKLQDNLLDTMAAQGWRTVFQWLTEGTEYRVIAFIYTNPNQNGGAPYWYIQGDKEQHTEIVWGEYSYDVPVPIGEWFKMEFFWHRSTGDDGRVYWAVNGQVIADRYGPNYGDNNNPIDRIAPFGVYTSPIAYPVYQWIDDVEVWDGFPAKR